MPTKKDGTKITWKVFFQEWKKGIESITPVQRLKNEVRANFTMLIGYLVGLAALIIKFNLIPNRILTIALIIIFFGAAWSNGIRWFAMRQQLKLFENLNTNSVDLSKIFENLENVSETNEKIIENGEIKGMESQAIKVEEDVDNTLKEDKGLKDG